MDKISKAIDTFHTKFNCAQAVLSAFADDFDLDEDTCLKLACPFGSGMGRMQKTCGAVTGAFMALGLKYGKGKYDDDSCKTKSYQLVNAFVTEFTAMNGSINCIDILGYDMKTEDGMKQIRDNQLFETICTKMVKDAVLITEKLMSE